MTVAELAYLGTDVGDQAFGTACLFAIDPDTGTTVWSFERRQRGAFWPVVSGELLVAAALSSPLVAFDVMTGEERWRQSFAAFEVHLDGQGNLLAVAQQGGRFRGLVSIDAGSGRERWRHEFEYAVGGLVLDDDRAVVSTSGQAQIFDVDTGELLHGPFDLGDSRAPVGLHGDLLVAYRPLTNVSVFDVTSGELVWERRVPGSRISDHVVTGGVLVVPSDDAQVHAYGLEDATVRWRAPLNSWPSSNRTPHDLDRGGRSLYVGTQTGLAAIDATTGEVRWEQDGRRARIPPLIVEDLVASQHGEELVVVDARDGQTLWTDTLPTSIQQLEATESRWLARGTDRVVGIER
jgi:outer membrane protein assembly factor BamB